MNQHLANLQAFANQLGCDFQLSPSVLDKLRETHLVLVGYGSIARPLAETLVELECRNLTLIDPKSYSDRSIASQCEPHEVGRNKALVGGERLAARGANVRVFDCDVYGVPDGVVPPGALIVTSVDNRRAEIRANRLAARMRSRLLKLNVEPEYQFVSARAYDFRFSPLLCLECQFDDRHYAGQRHPRSCDGPGEGRPTNSPRTLSQTAGQLGALAVLSLVSGEAEAAWWYGHQVQFFADVAKSARCELVQKEECRWEHGDCWQNVERLSFGPEEVSLADLLGDMFAGDPFVVKHFSALEPPSVDGMANAASSSKELKFLTTNLAGIGSSVELRFDQQVAMEMRCGQCREQVPGPRWIAEEEAPAGACPKCGGELRALPFWIRSGAMAGDFLPVLEWPLAEWGVPRGAVIEVRGEGKSKAYVLG